MATLIKTDGSESEVQSELMRHELYALVGNGCDMVQAVYLADGRTMWMDEESKIRPVQGTSQTPNVKATKLLAEAGGMLGDVVMGNVVICPAEQDEE